MNKIDIIVFSHKKQAELKTLELANNSIYNAFPAALNLEEWDRPIAASDYTYRIVDDLHLFIQTTPGGFFRTDLSVSRTLLYASNGKEDVNGDFFLARIPNFDLDEIPVLASVSIDDFNKVCLSDYNCQTLNLSQLADSINPDSVPFSSSPPRSLDEIFQEIIQALNAKEIQTKAKIIRL